MYLLFILVVQTKVNSQSIYLKFASATLEKSWCDIYLTGGKIPYKQSAILPSNNFSFLKCTDTLIKYEIFLDFADKKLKTFSKLNGYYNCGDSIIVDIDKRKAVIINMRKR